MKKVVAITIALAMVMSFVPAFAQTTDQMVALRAAAEMLGLTVGWNNDTRSVYIGEDGEAQRGEGVNLIMNGELVEGVTPVLIDDTAFVTAEEAEMLFADMAEKKENDLGGKHYVITNVGTGKALSTVELSAENSAALTTAEEADDTAYQWRLGKMGVDTYNISNVASGKSIDVPSASKDAGKGLIVYTTNGNSNQQWVFTAVEDGVYMINVVHSGLYMDASGDTLVQADKDETSDFQKWTLEYKGDSMLTSVVNSEGFALLSETEQDGFKRYMFGNLPACYAVSNSAESYLVSNGYTEAEPALQAMMLKTVLSYTASGQVSGDKLDQTSAKYEIVSETVDEEYDIWRGAKEKCWLYEVKMDGDEEGVVHEFTMVSNEENSEMVQIMIEALGSFPYAVRRYVNRLIWKWGDNANNYNGGGDTIWARLNWKPAKNSVIQTLSHELGHILDSNQLESAMIWTWAEAMDAVPISSYGSSNQAEDLAEFHRLYWTTLGKDTESAVAEVYPNRFRVLKGLLYRADKGHFAEFADDEQFILDIKAKIDAYGNADTASELDMGMYYSIIDPESNLAWTIENASMDNTAKVVLEEYTGADNQKFRAETFGGLVRFYNKNSTLPIQLHTSAMVAKPLTQYGGEWSVEDKFELVKEGEGYVLKSKRYDLTVRAFSKGVGESFVPFVGQDYAGTAWKIEAVEEGQATEIHTISVNNKYLEAADMLAFTDEATNGCDWILQDLGDNVFTVVNTLSGKALDVSGGSAEVGVKIIAYQQTMADNQCFEMEKSGDGYLLKMVHSGLYVTYHEDGTLTQEARDESASQVFVFTKK